MLKLNIPWPLTRLNPVRLEMRDKAFNSLAKIYESLIRRGVLTLIKKQLILRTFVRHQRHVGGIVSKDVIKRDEAADRTDIRQVLQQFGRG